MGDHRLFSDFSTEELEEEVKRRKNIKPMPNSLSNTDYGALYNYTISFIDRLGYGKEPLDDYNQTIFEMAIEAVYGKEIWQWWRDIV